jgi:uncharacterized membrane protein
MRYPEDSSNSSQKRVSFENLLMILSSFIPSLFGATFMSLVTQYKGFLDIRSGQALSQHAKNFLLFFGMFFGVQFILTLGFCRFLNNELASWMPKTEYKRKDTKEEELVPLYIKRKRKPRSLWE